jgi:dTDP-4-amino-4,6-dideoxygalactose transaminase
VKIPFVDLKAQYHALKTEMDAAIFDIIENTAFIKGKQVSEFERAFAEKYGVKNCIGLANGTDALYIAMKMLGIGPGDEVITTAWSWISTSETVSQTGARPVFVDVDEYYTIDAAQIESKITPRTKALIPVHLYGQAAQMDVITEIAKKYNLFLIEDCAQSHFTKFNGHNAGTFGQAGTFSFYPGKNLGAYGDAGAILTNSNDLADKFRMYASHGALIKHHHEMEGINSRLDGLQAAVLNVKLKYIDEWNKRRQENALLYSELLKEVPNLKISRVRENTEHTFHIYCIQAGKREALRDYLAENGIETQIHYPVMLPFMPAYKYLNYKHEDFPRAYAAQDKILSLPMYAELEEKEIKYITDCIKKFYSL